MSQFCFCPLLSGSSGNATYIAAGRDRILIDCGESGKTIANALDRIGVEASSLRGIFLTHAHNDHIRGAGVLSRRYHLPIYATAGTWKEIDRWNAIGKILPEHRRLIDSGSPQIETGFEKLEITCFPLPHDTPEPVGYRLTAGKKTVAVATDIGYVTDSLRSGVSGADYVLLESNHDIEMLKNGPYPWPLKRRILSNYGHLSNDAAGLFAAELVQSGTSLIYLGHLSHENNRPMIAYDTVSERLRGAKIDPERDLTLKVALRYDPSEPVRW